MSCSDSLPTQLDEHEGALFVTGGVGVAHNLAIFAQAIATEARKSSLEKEQDHATATRYVELLWFARFPGEETSHTRTSHPVEATLTLIFI